MRPIIDNRAMKELAGLPKQVRARTRKEMEAIAADPFGQHPNAKTRSG